MRITDIRGEKAFDIIADAMELAELLSKDERFKELLEGFGKTNGDNKEALAVLCKAAPLIRDKKYNRRIVSILAKAKGVPTKEYAANGDVIGDVMELLTSDIGAIDFFGSASESTEQSA